MKTSCFVICAVYLFALVSGQQSNILITEEYYNDCNEAKEPPVLVYRTTGSRWIFFVWDFSNNLETNCSVKALNMTCTYGNRNQVLSHLEYIQDEYVGIIEVNKTDLLSNTKYTCSASLINWAGQSGSSQSIDIVTLEEVSEPSRLVNVTTGSRWIFFTWNLTNNLETNHSVEALNLTCICYENTIFSQIEYIQNGHNGIIQVNKTDLIPNTKYTCWASLINMAGQSEPSESIDILTLGEGNEAPVLVYVTRGSRWIFFVWDFTKNLEDNSSVEALNLTCTYENENRSFSQLEYIQNEYIGIVKVNKTGLIPNTTYTCWASLTKLAGQSEPSESIDIWTLEEGNEPPVLVYVTSGSRWIFFVWDITKNLESISSFLELNLTCTCGNGNQIFSQLESLQNRHFDIFDVNKTDLIPNTKYTCWAFLANNSRQSEPSEIIDIWTLEEVPSQPRNIRLVSITNSSFIIAWDPPEKMSGVQGDYKVELISAGPLHLIAYYCNVTQYFNYTYFFNHSVTEFKFMDGLPNFRYQVQVSASTGAGFGDQAFIEVITTEGASEPVRHLSYKIHYSYSEEYQANLNVSFKQPCNSNGIIRSYSIHLEGFRPPDSEIIYETDRREVEEPILIQLRPGYVYVLRVRANNNYANGQPAVRRFISPDGVPPPVMKTLREPRQVDSTSTRFVFGNYLFSNSNGDIIYYALILADAKFNSSTYGFWNVSQGNWPTVGFWTNKNDVIYPYQSTPDFWNPFAVGCRSCNFTFTFGSNLNCEPNTTCNGPLRPDRFYSLLVRGFTRHGFRDSKPLIFYMSDFDGSTNKLDVTLLLGVVLGIVGVTALSGFSYVVWKKQVKGSPKITSSAPPVRPNELNNFNSHPIPVPLPVKKFSAFYSDLKKDNYNILKQQYALINTKSSEEMLPHYAGLLPVNRKKNRYTNILPFDETRVKIINKKQPKNDYINACFIKGYSGKVEYIATQGPLLSTCADFWKMIIQQNVTVIAMVAQFVENGQSKCYKYFPNKHENMDVGEGIEIRCATELNFGMYCLRTILVQKDLKQWTVTHLQFLDWPDHGCPTGTDVVIHFRHVLRQHVEKKPGPIAVHCSAGVGRTGTLIAVDILLQAVKHKKDIDIFSTVLSLRRQRTKMVQTEKQYIYIHDCIFSVVKNPKLLNWDRKRK